jgi:membrane fusion protein (multidrug efflux system)
MAGGARMKRFDLYLGIVLLALAGCGAREAIPAEEGAAPSVTVVRPGHGDVARTITLPGDLVPLNRSELFAKVTGYVKRISVDKGDWVRKGQVLAEIEVPELEQKLRRARANLQVRRVTYERLKGVWETDRRLVAREDVDIAEGAYEQAGADVDELAALLGYTHIVAPFDGVVTARYVDPGALVQATEHAGQGDSKGGSAPIVTVADIDTVRVYVYVPEEETSVIRQGLPATLRLREFTGRSFNGVVQRFATSLDLSTRTMLTEVDIENRDHELYPGMYADVTLELARHAGVVKVPDAAIGTSKADPFVYLVKDDRIVKRPVVIGLRAGGETEITSGLTGDESVVSPLSPALSDREKVHAVQASAGSRAIARAD